jgi:thiol-disulfide isomerase/thioredoxin
MKRFLLPVSFFLFLMGCQKPIPQQAYWSGALHRTDSTSIPFRAFIDLHATPPSGYFLVGGERTQIPEIEHRRDSLVLLFSGYNAAMRGTLDGAVWRGDYIRYRTTPMAIPFEAHAEILTQSDSAASAKPAIPLVGKFRAFLREGNSVDSTTVATFWMSNDSIYGTLIAPDGDYGLNAGTQQGTSVSLSRFTGWQAQLFNLSRYGNSWAGSLYVRNDPPVTITLEPGVSLKDDFPGERKTAMKNPGVPFVFSGITPDGDTLTNTSAQFKGKALIIDIMGTWCHNCMDEAPVLQQFYDEFKNKGLEVVGLSYEINDNPEQGKKNLRLYQKRFRLTFPLLFCGSTDNKYVGPQLRAQLDNFYAYPTALFLDKRGIVRSVHIGFKGPGTGEDFQAEINHLYDIVKKISGS